MRQVSKNTLVITGYSDDNLEFDGSIYDEVGCYGSTPVVELPDGAIFKWSYTGIWEVEQISVGNLYGVEIQKGNYEEDTNDVLTVTAQVPYVIVRIDENLQVLGEMDLTKEQQRVYDRLKTAFFDVEEFEQRDNTVKAILAGIDPF